MGVIVPVLLFVLLDLEGPGALGVLAVTCFAGWGVTDVVATVLARERIAGRSARGVVDNWEKRRAEEREAEPRNDPS